MRSYRIRSHTTKHFAPRQQTACVYARNTSLPCCHVELQLVQKLHQQLCVPCDSAKQIVEAIHKEFENAGLQERDVQMCEQNIQLLMNVVPRSRTRQLQKVLLNNPAVLLSPLVSWSEFLGTYGVTQQALCDIVMWQAAKIITGSTPYQAGTVIMTLQQWGLTSIHINRSVLVRAPQVLLLQQSQLQALHDFFSRVCLLPASRTVDLVVATPMVLLQHVQEELQPRVSLLQQELGADTQQMASMLHSSPWLLMADFTKNLQPRLQQLRQFGFQGPELLQLVVADPNVLSLTQSCLQRKWHYLTEQMGLSKQAVLHQCPLYFSKNLMTEVGPRHTFVLQRGLQACVACDQHAQLQAGHVAGGNSGSQSDGHVEVQQQLDPQTGQEQQQPCQCTLHLGKLLDPCLTEFLDSLGQPDVAAEFAAHSQLWAQTQGLKWTATRVT